MFVSISKIYCLRRGYSQRGYRLRIRLFGMVLNKLNEIQHHMTLTVEVVNGQGIKYLCLIA